MIAWLETRRALVIVLALGFFAMAARTVTDPDVWWHLRTGQIIADTHSFVRTDPFSFTRHGQPWVNHEWLSDLLLYLLYRMAGWGGLIAAAAVLTSITMMFVFARSPGRPYFATLALLWGGYAAAPTWGVRPHTISLLLASILLLLLDKSEKSSGLLWWAVPLTLLWVNLHAEYALGIAFIALFLAGESLEVVCGCQGSSHARTRIRNLALTLVACLAVVPLNPNGVAMYLYPVTTLRSPAMQRYIAEWGSPNFHEPKYLPFAFMLLAILFLLARSTQKLRVRDLLLLLVMTAAALRSVRHISSFVLVGAPILSGLLYDWWRSYDLQLGRKPQTRWRMGFNGLILATFLAFAAVRLHSVVIRQPQTETENFPAGAVNFLASSQLRGPVLNHYNFGGYFIWRLSDRNPVYIDGRADLYGDKFLDQFAHMYYVAPDWKQPIQNWGIRTVVLPPDAPVLTALKLTGEWDEAYRDANAVVLTRRP